MTNTTAPAYTTIQFVEDITALLQDELGLRPYEAEEFTATILAPHFFEFWFSGKSGSFKVYLDGNRIPYAYDQNHTKVYKATVKNVNARIQELAAKF